MQQNDRQVFISEWLQPPHFVGSCALSSARDSGLNPNGIRALLPHGMQLTELFLGPQPSNVWDLKHSPGLPGMELGGGAPRNGAGWWGSHQPLPAPRQAAVLTLPHGMATQSHHCTASTQRLSFCSVHSEWGKKACWSNTQINTTPSRSIYQKEKQASSVGSFWLLLFQHTRMQGSVIYYLRLTNNFSIL